MAHSDLRRPGAAPAPRGKGWIWLAGAVVLLVLAWFDGGEEPVHPIAQEIPVPEAR